MLNSILSFINSIHSIENRSRTDDLRTFDLISLRITYQSILNNIITSNDLLFRYYMLLRFNISISYLRLHLNNGLNDRLNNGLYNRNDRLRNLLDNMLNHWLNNRLRNLLHNRLNHRLNDRLDEGLYLMYLRY